MKLTICAAVLLTAAEPATAQSLTAPAAPPVARAGRINAALADPFEVSPQLREGRRSTRFAGLPDANVLDLQRRIELKSILRTAGGKLAVAQLLINQKDTITVMNKELIDLGEMGTFQVDIDSGTVTLSNPSTPQGKKVVLR